MSGEGVDGFVERVERAPTGSGALHGLSSTQSMGLYACLGATFLVAIMLGNGIIRR